MPAKCAPHETIALNREIRTRIGQRLREHYDLAQRIPFPHALRNWPSSLVNKLRPTRAKAREARRRGAFEGLNSSPSSGGAVATFEHFR